MTNTRERKLLNLLVGWTILIYGLFGLLSGPPNFWDHYVSPKYLNVAEALLEGRGYAEPVHPVPLYPLVLAGVLRLFGYASWPVLLLHTGLGVTTAYCTYKTGRALFSPAIGLLAGFLISVHPYLVKLTMQIIDTGPSVTLTAVAMWLLVRAWLAPDYSPSRYGWAGVALGLATLARPVAGVATVILGGSISLGLASRGRLRHAITAAAMIWLAWAAVMSPWWLRNWLCYEQFIPLTTHGGVNFLKGHTATYTRVHPIYDTDHFPYVEAPVVSGDPSGYLTDELRKQRAWKYIRDHPVEAVVTDLRKVLWLYTWHKVPRSLVGSQPRWDPSLQAVVEDGNPRPAPQDIIYSIYWVPMLFLFVLGLVLSRSHCRRLIPIYALVLANALTAALTFADTRYRLEVDPYIAIWAAYGVAGLVAWAGRKSTAGWLAAGSHPSQTET